MRCAPIPDSVRMSWLESVASVHVPGFVPTDFLAGLRSTEGFTSDVA